MGGNVTVSADDAITTVGDVASGILAESSARAIRTNPRRHRGLRNTSVRSHDRSY